MFSKFVSEIGTIMVQVFLINIVGHIVVIGCVNNLIKHRKRGKRLREYTCPECGFSAWALDHIIETNCHQCGASVKTKPVVKIERCTVCGTSGLKGHKRELNFVKK